MKRDQRLLLVAVGAASHWEILITRLELACSISAKRRFGQFSNLGRYFYTALGDPDDRVTVEIRNAHSATKGKSLMSWLLAGLVVVVFFEWRTYTIPTIVECLKYLAHRCGLQ